MCFAGVWAEQQPVFQLSQTSKHADAVKHLKALCWLDFSSQSLCKACHPHTVQL